MSKIKIFSLGGLNEDGKNMYVVEVDDDIFVFDAGLKYTDDSLFGIDYIIPDISYLKKRIKKVQGIFITHGHDENVGALPEIIKVIPEIKVYGTKFTLDIIKKMLEEDKVKTDNLIPLYAHRKIDFGKNSVFPISLTHSIPDNVGYVLNTEDGAIFYTGNFVFDTTMMGPYKTDIGKLAYVGKQGVLCLLSESLYAERSGFTSPHHRISSLIRETLDKKTNRIVFNVVSANMYRVQELFTELVKTDRKVVIMGKRLQSMINNLIDRCYLKINKNKIGTLSNINDEDIVILIASEYERPLSNLNRIVKGYDKFIKIKETDTVVFLEPVKDGEQRLFVFISDEISRLGGDVITLSKEKHLLHHASREDLLLMLDLIKPKYYFPVIGQYRYQVANAKIALKMGMKEENILLKLNGEVVSIEKGLLKETNQKVSVDDVLIDGTSIGDIGELVLKDREMLSTNGIVIVIVSLNKITKEILAGPEILTRGFIYVKENIDLIKEIKEESLKVIKKNIKNKYVDFTKIKVGIRDEVGRFLYKKTESRPMIITVVLEV